MFKDSWRKSLHRVPVVKIKELAIAAQGFFKHPQSRLNFQWSPLHIAADYGSLEFYKYISRKCGCINHVGGNGGSTSIHMAASAGHLEIVTFIIDNLQDQNQSAASCRIDAVSQPTFGDPVCNPEKADGLTPLHFAALNGRFETCKFLMNLLKNKNPGDNYGVTPLHGAAKGGNIEIYKLIMENLVDKNPKNSSAEGVFSVYSGSTPLGLAKFWGKLKVVNSLMRMEFSF